MQAFGFISVSFFLCCPRTSWCMRKSDGAARRAILQETGAFATAAVGMEGE